MKVGLFIPCYINAVYPEVGIASYKLLRHVGVDVDYPMDQTCCGQPMANAGFEDEAARLALRMEEQFKNYDYVVGPSASCVAFVKENHPHILGKRDHVCMNSKKIYDICEFLHDIVKVKELKAQGINPCLAVILVGENPASQVYVRGKINDCAQCGIESRSINLPADTTQETLLAEVKKLAADPAVHGILVQLPLPAQIDEKAVIDAIPPEKDVDGFSPVNVGRMQIGEPCYLPCTPAGCIRMIESTGTDIAGKNAVVIGRSNIVGKPAALLLLAKNPTVTICHSKTKNLKEVCAAADILVAAVGREGFVTGDMVKPGAVVIDVGINRGADGKLHGDVNFAEAAEKAAYITPVPGGVGSVTTSVLMKHVIEAAERV